MFFHVIPGPAGKLPTRATRLVNGIWVPTDSVGYDLYAASDGSIGPLSRGVIGLDIRCSFTPGYVGMICDRSGLAVKSGITCLAGIIDPDYRGEWKVCLYNTSIETFHWTTGDRIAQVIFLPVALPEVCQVESLEDTIRGELGFGSTG